MKSGKKLVWSKGIAVSQTQLDSRPIPTETTKPTVTPSSSPTLAPTPTTKPTSEIANAADEAIAKEININFGSQSSRTELLDIYYSPSTYQDSGIVKKNVEDAFKSIAYWESLGIKFNQKIALVFVTEKDWTWWKDFKTRLKSEEYELDKTLFANYVTQPFGGYVGVGRNPNSLNTSYYVLLFLASNLDSARNEYWAETMAPHEFVHIAQHVMVEKNGDFSAFDRYACWFIEGLARFYERATQYDRPYEGILSYHEMKIRQLSYFDYIIPRETAYEQVKNWTEDTYLQFLIDHQYRDKTEVCSKTGYGYSIGWPLAEKFYFDFGPTLIVRLMQEVKSTSDWDMAFKITTGQEYKSWLKEKAIPYLLQQK